MRMAITPATPGRPRLQTDDPVVARRRERWRSERARRAAIIGPRHRAIIDAFLDTECVDCGVKFPRPAMHPDHVRGKKKYKIAWFNGGNGSERTLREELAKCEVRCANCHCIRHASAAN